MWTLLTGVLSIYMYNTISIHLWDKIMLIYHSGNINIICTFTNVLFIWHVWFAGLGKCIAQNLLTCGARVIILDVLEDRINEFKSEVNWNVNTIKYKLQSSDWRAFKPGHETKKQNVIFILNTIVQCSYCAGMVKSMWHVYS